MRRTLSVAGLLLLCCASLFAQDQWWEREPLRIVDVTSDLTKFETVSPAVAAAQKADLGFNAEHLAIMQIAGGLDDEHFYFVSKEAGRQNIDYLKRYLPEAHKRGIRVLIYFDVHWYSVAFGEKHPDWRQIREDGKPLDAVYDNGTSFCVNSPWRKWVFQVLRDLAAYPIDGIFFDGPIYFPNTCYCPYCREKFRRIYGADMPSKKVRQGPDFQRLVEFQANSLADFLRDSRTVLHSINPNLALYMNGGARGANWATGRLNRVLVKEQDLLGSEGGFLDGDLTRVPLWKPSLTARLLETQSEGKPRVIFSAASHKPWTFSLLPAPELRLLYAGTIANAASVWFGITPFDFGRPQLQALKEMNDFQARNARYYEHTQSAARVALVWSDTTANFYAGAGAQMIDIDQIRRARDAGDLDGEFSGIAEALMRTHVPFDVIDDTRLESDSLSGYKAIFLPNVACMSDAVAGRLREYVEQGGTLFSTFETSVYNEVGIHRPDFALADLFGVHTDGKIAGPMRWDFMKPAGSDPLLKGMSPDFIPALVYHVRASAAGGRPLLYFTKPMRGRYDGVPEVSNQPALVERQSGKGVSIYCSGNLGAAIEGFHLPEWLGLVGNTVREFAPARVSLEGLPASVEVVLRTQDEGKRWLLHLVNYTGGMTRPIQQITPLHDVRIALPASPTFHRAFTLYHPRSLALERDAHGRPLVTLPKLEEYEVIVLE